MAHVHEGSVVRGVGDSHPDACPPPCTTHGIVRHISYPFGIFGRGMHDFVVREVEVGTRVASYEDDEAVRIWPLCPCDWSGHCAMARTGRQDCGSCAWCDPR